MSDFVYFRKENYLFSKLYRVLGKHVVMALMKTSITPNMITLVGLCIVIPTCFISSIFWSNAITALLIQLVFFFDIVDGDLARNKKMCSTLGARLDYFTDMFFYLGFYVFLGWYKEVPLILVAAFALIQFLYGRAATVYLVPHIKKISNLKRPKIKQFFWDRGIIFGMDVSLLDVVISVSLLMNRISYGYIAVCILWCADLIYRVLKLRT